jgi:hypothetical protein
MMGQMAQAAQGAMAPKAAPAAAPAAAPGAGGGLVQCTACKAQVAPGKFCAECGATLAPAKKFCASCGVELVGAAKFCSGCGTPAA